MLEDSYGYDLSYDRFDSFGSYGSKAWKTVCTISHNLLGQLLQFSFPRRRMSIGVGLAFGCPDLPWFASQICGKKILRTASIEVHGFTMTSQVWLHETTRLAPFVPRLFVGSERLRQRCIHVLHFWPLGDTCKTLLSVVWTEDRTFQGSMDRNVGIVSCRHLSGSLTLRLWDSLEPGSQQKPRRMRSEESTSKESKSKATRKNQDNSSRIPVETQACEGWVVVAS